MRLSFRQGIVKCSVDSSNNPNCYKDDILPSYVSLYANHSSVIVTFANKESNYLFEDSNTIDDAWGPFTLPLKSSYWLYWDLDTVTGLRTFGFTQYEPIISSTAPRVPVVSLHWYDTTRDTMFEYNGKHWIEKLRVFACRYDGISIFPYAIGTQVSNNTECLSGYILFDTDSEPLTRKGGTQFVTTESNLYTTKSIIDPVDFSSSLFYAAAQGHIPEYRVVSFYKDNKIQLASCYDSDHKAAIGMVRTEVFDSEVSGVVTNGYITYILWNFSEPPSTAVYLGDNGLIQTTVPSSGFIQKIGTIVSNDTIFIDIDPQIIYAKNTADELLTLPVTVDLFTGKLYTTSTSITNLGGLVSGAPGTSSWLNLGGFDADGLESLSFDEEVTLPPGTVTSLPSASTGGTVVVGYTYTQILPSIQWTLDHNQGTTNSVIQITDESGTVLTPSYVKIVSDKRIVVGFTAPTTGTAQILLTNANPLAASTTPVLFRSFVRTTPSQVWSVSHNLGYIPIARSYINGVLTIPISIVHDSLNSTTITFASPVSGRAQFL